VRKARRVLPERRAGPSSLAQRSGGRQGRCGSARLDRPDGAQGPLASAANTVTWSLYRGYDFAYARDDIHENDVKKAAQVAEYVNRNPSFVVALDGSSTRRVHAVREALISAGVPA
jgi:hypothetical protein